MRRIFGLLVILLVLNSCAHRVVVVNQNQKKVPPGQLKKVTGSQSAKPYAPGQQKAHVQEKQKAHAPGQQKKKH